MSKRIKAMNWKSKSLLPLTGMAFAGLATVALLSSTQISVDDRNAFCADLDNVMLDQELPVIHPANRCATEQSQGISWSEWFTGRSSSYQFHFIDLLELLSRPTNTET